MTEGLLELALSNLLLSGAIGLLAYGVHRRGRYPALAHLLWVLTLVKAVTPPLFKLPVAVPLAQDASPAMASSSASAAGAGIDLAASLSSWLGTYGPALLVGAWFVGSGLVILITVTRIRRFGRLLSETSTAAPPEGPAHRRCVRLPAGTALLPLRVRLHGGAGADDMVESRSRADRRAAPVARGSRRRPAALGPGARAGPHQAPRSAGALARVGCHGRGLVEPGGVVGSSAAATGRRRCL